MNHHDQRIVIVGGGAAAAAALDELNRLGFTGTVTVVGAETERPYNRTTVNKGLLNGEASASSVDLAVTPPAHTRWLLGHQATGLDLASRTVRVHGHSPLHFDGLVLACGAIARPLPPTWLPFLYGLNDLRDGGSLRAAVQAVPRRVIVLGAGLIGTETAGILTSGGHRVTLVDADERPLEARLGPLVAEWARERHRSAGVLTQFGRRVVYVAPADGDSVGVELDDGTVLAADVVVNALGTVPSTSWLADSGLEIADGVRTDAELRVSISGASGHSEAVPGIVAYGDLARWSHRAFGGALHRVAHWGNALSQGKHAARTVLRDLGLASPTDGPVQYDELPAFSTYVHGTKVHVVGLPHLATRTAFVRGDSTPSASRSRTPTTGA